MVKKGYPCKKCGTNRILADFRAYRTSPICRECNLQKHRKEITCKFCKEKCIKKLGDITRKGRGQFCNKDCYDKWQKRNRIECVCLNCKKSFKIQSYVRQKGMFCSIKCRNSSWGRKTIAKYKDKEHKGRLGISYYRKLAFETYENKCKKCGYNNFKEVLEVDHIDGNHLNNILENLQILCPTCHKEKSYKHLLNKPNAIS